MDRLRGYNLYKIEDTKDNPSCPIKHILIDYFPTHWMAKYELDQYKFHSPLNNYKIISAFAGEDSEGIHSVSN